VGWERNNFARAPLDLSEGGARVLLDRRIQPGTKVKLTLEVRKFGDAIRASGLVRWCFESGTRRGDFHAGIEFTDLPEAQRKQIAAMRAWFTSSKCLSLRAARGRDAEEPRA